LQTTPNNKIICHKHYLTSGDCCKQMN